MCFVQLQLKLRMSGLDPAYPKKQTPYDSRSQPFLLFHLFRLFRFSEDNRMGGYDMHNRSTR